MNTSTMATPGFPPGLKTVPIADIACRQSDDSIFLMIELPNTPENWTAAGLLGRASALALPVASPTASLAGAAPGRAATRTGDDTPLANKLAGTTKGSKATSKRAQSGSGAASKARSGSGRGAAASKLDASANTDQQRVPETA